MSKKIKVQGIRPNSTAKESSSTPQKNTEPRSQTPCENCYNRSFIPDSLDLLDLENEVIGMVRNYKKNQYALITNPSTATPLVEDAKSVHFTLNRLKSFIFEIENLCCENNCSVNLGELGIRFYYASYPTPNNYDLSYNGMHTLILVPTFKQGNIHIDFCPDRFDPSNPCVPTTVQSLLNMSNYGANINRPIGKEKSASKRTVKQKIMALVGGFPDTRPDKLKIEKGKKKKASSLKNKNNQTTIPNDPNPPTAMVHTLLNHGDLIPPPGSINTPYPDAALLNC